MPHKRVDLLLHAVARMHHQWPGLTVDIVGNGPCRVQLEELSTELGLTDTVRFHGRVSEEDKSSLLSKAGLGVNPSISEGWGITVMEAAAAGLPSLAFDVPGLNDSILDGETGWLVPEGEDLGEAMSTALGALAIPRSARNTRNGPGAGRRPSPGRTRPSGSPA